MITIVQVERDIDMLGVVFEDGDEINNPSVVFMTMAEISHLTATLNRFWRELPEFYRTGEFKI